MGKAIGNGLANNIRLQELYLSHNLFTEVGTYEIAKALETNDGIRLKVLDLSHNYLRDQGANDFSRTLKVNKSLERLNISVNGIHNKGG